MKSHLALALAAGFSLFAAAPALAADNLAAKDNAGVSFKYRAFDLSGGVYLPAHALLDTTGAPFLTSANPGFFTISGVVPLPVGAATSANQVTANSSLATIATNTAGVATAAAQTTGNSSLASIVAGVGAPADATWDGAAASATHTSILKTIVAKLSGLITVDTVVRSTGVDVGGTITAGGTAQTFSAASATARGVMLQNQSNADLWFVCSGSAATMDFHSLKVPAGALYSSDAHHASAASCSVIGATTGQAFFARRL